MNKLDTFGMVELTESEMVETNGGDATGLQIVAYYSAWAMRYIHLASRWVSRFVSRALRRTYPVNLGPWPWQV